MLRVSCPCRATQLERFKYRTFFVLYQCEHDCHAHTAKRSLECISTLTLSMGQLAGLLLVNRRCHAVLVRLLVLLLLH